VVEARHLTAKPAEVTWEVAGALFVAGATACASVRAVSLSEGDTVVVSAAAGGVGSLAVQLARRTGATVIGLASAANHPWLAKHDVIPVAYVQPSRIDTIANFEAASRYGVKDAGNAAGASASVLAELAGLIAAGELEVPIAATFPLDGVQDAYRRLAAGHLLGKIVLLP
jgi:NADPH:quinone reductase-like Zn-dependent oxidoreductase